MVSVGPGFAEHITPAARAAIEHADVVVSYDLYLTWVSGLISGKEVITHPLTEEKARAKAAIRKARAGRCVAILSSGDIGVYGMASLVFEDMDETDEFAVSVIPGITAANACASILGAPLAHDFLILSLSDLLCPWEWIESRARHAAEADLCMALYNVCSKKRPDGIYKLLDIIAYFKSESTLCGIVRNAYRPEQSAQIVTLGELRQSKFDMLTSIIIGNKFTLRKRQWLFTPRGYNSFKGHGVNLPERAVWVFSGTSDGNELARRLSEEGHPIVLSAATEYGASLARKACPDGHVIAGRIGKPGRIKCMKEAAAAALVDATHPYADVISRQLIDISDELGLPYLRFERPSSQAASQSQNVVATLEEALWASGRHGKRIFLACGSKRLDEIDARWTRDLELFLRIPPDPEGINRAIELGIPAANIIAMQGPFSKDLNIALWRDLQIDAVISKESGHAGGFDAKLQAADQLGIPLYVISRPRVEYPRLASSFADVSKFLAGVKQ